MNVLHQDVLPVLQLPRHQGLFYGGSWHRGAGERLLIENPATGEGLAEIETADLADVDAVVAAAQDGFAVWRDVVPFERGRILREMAAILRSNGRELAMLDAADSGNPYREMLPDAAAAAAFVEFFAGLVTEVKGSSLPMGPEAVNFSVREPLGVVVRLLAFNHPMMFCAAKSAAILAAGNAIIVKPPEQAPLSALRLAELLGPLFPAGVFNVVPGGRAVGAAMVGHPQVAAAALVGSVAAGRAVMRVAAERVKPVVLELGGKNPLIAFPDADPDRVAEAVVAGMNFGWCGQSCGSTSRAFLHADIHDAVVERVIERVAHIRPGLPTDPDTRMGAMVSRTQHERVLAFVAKALEEGATLAAGGGRPDDPVLARGHFLMPTVFTQVTHEMVIAREEVFGPVLAVLRWEDEATMLEQVNGTDYGLTASIWTEDLTTAHRVAGRVEAGYVWINEVGKHFIGASFGGTRQSGIGREESIEELYAFTREKNVHIRLTPR